MDKFRILVPDFIRRKIKYQTIIRFPLYKLINPYWHREAVGGLWEEIGKLQFEFLKKEGLLPHHFLLDIGCGSLRGGIHFIRYLEEGHYMGIDKDRELINAGKKELKREKLIYKNPKLLVSEIFKFDKFGVKFDYAIAVSVFTHISLNYIILCLKNLKKVLKKNGKFYATIFEVDNLYTSPPEVQQPHGALTYLYRDPFHYSPHIFVYLAKELNYEFHYIGDWGHPRNQKMILFINKY